MSRKIVYICSPLRASTREDMQANIDRANAYCAMAARKENAVPLAPHAIFTQFLDDYDQRDRLLGLQMGLELLPLCDELWVCGGRISEGMWREIGHAQEVGVPVVYLDGRGRAEA